MVNAAGANGIPGADWCEDNKEKTVRTNTIGWLNVADVCNSRGIHLTHFGTGCVYTYDDEHPIGGKTYTEEDTDNAMKAFYTRSKARSQELMMMAYASTTLLLRLRVPVGDELHARSFITKIATYARVVDIPNSITVLPDLLPAAVRLARERKVGTFNFTNPGRMSHHEVLRLYKKYIDPSFTWVGMTEAEQNKILKSERANNELDVTKLKEALPDMHFAPVEEAMEALFTRMRDGAPRTVHPRLVSDYFDAKGVPVIERMRLGNIRACEALGVSPDAELPADTKDADAGAGAGAGAASTAAAGAGAGTDGDASAAGSSKQVLRDVSIGKGTKVWNFVNMYGCEVGEDCMIGTFVEVQSGVKIGDRTRVQSHTFLCEGVSIGDDVFVGHGVMTINDTMPPQSDKTAWKRTVVEDHASIGSNATLMPVTIGKHAVVGAGAVVTKDVPPGAIVAGNPSKVMRYKDGFSAPA